MTVDTRSASAARVPATRVRSPADVRRLAAGLVAAAIGLGFALRLWQLSDLQVYGDGAYSVYLAGQNPLEIARLTARDSHPPLYYLLLAAWLAVTGTSELTVRFVSVATGLLVIPLTFVLGRRLFGPATGIVAAGLAALSPLLIYYARFPRMYALLAAVGLLSLYLLVRYLDGKSGRRVAVAFGIALWVAVQTHYFGAVLGLSEGVLLLIAWRRGNRRALGLLLAAAVAALLSLPWLTYGFFGAARFTAANIANAPAPEGIGGFLDQFWVPFHFGPLIETATGRPFLLVAGALLAGLAWLTRRRQRTPDPPNRWWLPVAFLGVSFLLTFGIFLVFPYFARHRFLIFDVPVYLILVAALLVAAWRAARRATAAAVAVLLGLTAWALVAAYRVEPLIYEPDAARITRILEAQAQPGDLAVFQAAWQFGYLRAHFDGPALELRDLETVAPDDLLAAATQGRRVWLAMYQRGVRDPDFPIEERLDRSLPKVFSRDLEHNRLALYAPPPAGEATPGGPTFVDPATGRAVARLGAVRLPAHLDLVPGEALPVELTWDVINPPERNLSVFLHLDALDGRTFAARDAEPRTGLAPTSTWAPGETVRDPRGLILPPDIPPGDYELTVGLYDPSTLETLPVQAGAAGRPPAIARVTVRAPAGPSGPPPAQALGVRYPEPIRLAGVTLGDGEPAIDRTVLRRAYLDNPAEIHRPKTGFRPGETVDLTLFWQALGRVGADYTVFVHLIDSAGRPVAQQDNPPVEGRYPTSQWTPGTTVLDTYRLKLPETLPAGAYRLIVGLYRPETGERLAPVSGPGRRAAGAVDLGTIDVLPRPAGETPP